MFSNRKISNREYINAKEVINMRVFYDSGRMRELNSLDELYGRDGFVAAVIYGRRRVGKTSLIGEFVRRGNKKAVRFTATENTEFANREDFSKSVFAVYPAMSALGCFPSWESAFVYIAAQSNGERVVVEIDEYPYLAKSYLAVSSEFQKCIDNVMQNTSIMLVLCGSSMSFMENQVLGYQSPLYGRRTAQYRVAPLDYYDSAEFFGRASCQDKLLGYSVTGGIPQYLSTVARGMGAAAGTGAGTVAGAAAGNMAGVEAGVEAGIERAFFYKDGFLYEEPQNLLKQELREPALYNAIITAVAGGATKLGEIAGKTREPESKTLKYIKNLIDLGILDKEFPMLAQGEKRGVYYIKDNMYRFWHRFVPGMVTLIENGYESIYEKKVKPFIPEYMGHAFESICRQYLLRLNIQDRLPFLFEKIGRWWGVNAVTKREEEIGVVAASKDGLIVGECKWQNEEAGHKVYMELRNKTSIPPFAGKDIYYYIFSKSGFSAALAEDAKNDARLALVSLDDLFAL